MSWGDWYDVWRMFGTRSLPAFVHAKLARRPIAFSTTVGLTCAARGSLLAPTAVRPDAG
jgi:hypothetical protein